MDIRNSEKTVGNFFMLNETRTSGSEKKINQKGTQLS